MDFNPEVFLNSQIPLLVELQRLDQRIHDLRRQQSAIPQHIAAAQAPLLEATKALEEAQAALERIATERRAGEQDLSAQEAHVQKLRARLADIKTNKEYQTHLFEIDLANKRKDALEERVLMAMERAEEKQKECENWAAAVKEAEQAFEQEKARLEAQEKTLASELAQLEEQQKSFTALLDTSVYRKYSSLKNALRVMVLATVENATCGGCRLQLPPQLGAEAKRSTELIQCPYCQRILYSPEALEDAKQSGSLVTDEAGEEL